MEDRLIELFTLKATGSISENDEAELEKLLEKPEARKIYSELNMQWSKSANYKAAASPETGVAWEAIKLKISRSGKARFVYSPFVRIAAVLLIGLSIAYYFLTSGTEVITYQTGPNETSEITLPDGSSVYLNSSSEISYYEDFNSSNRNVNFNGEAYFQIIRNPEKPFIISSEVAAVEVLGTSFNVKAYAKDEEVIVNVNTGRVAFSSRVKNSRLVLEKGMRGVLNKSTGSISSLTPTLDNTDFWRTGNLSYDNNLLKDVVTDLEELFDISIAINESKIGNCRITSSFKDSSPEEILEIIAATMNLSVVKTAEGYELVGEGCDQFN